MGKPDTFTDMNVPRHCPLVLLVGLVKKEARLSEVEKAVV